MSLYARWQYEYRPAQIRRAGELLKQIMPKQGARTDLELSAGAPTILTRKLAAEDAGFSPRQRNDALRALRWERMNLLSK